MQITIQEEDKQIIISNDYFEVDNFVSLIIERTEKTEDEDEHPVVETSIEVPIDELYSAIKTFYDHRIRERKADNLLKD